MSGEIHVSRDLAFAPGEIGLKDVTEVRGKIASPRRICNVLPSWGVAAPHGFRSTEEANRHFPDQGDLREQFAKVGLKFLAGVPQTPGPGADAARAAILSNTLPEELRGAILRPDAASLKRGGRRAALAVRSSALAEDLPHASDCRPV